MLKMLRFCVLFVALILHAPHSPASPPLVEERIGTRQIEEWLLRIKYMDFLKKTMFRFIEGFALETGLPPPTESEKSYIWEGYLQYYDSLVHGMIIEEYNKFYDQEEFKNLVEYFNGELAPHYYFALLDADEKARNIAYIWLDKSVSNLIADLPRNFPSINIEINWDNATLIKKLESEHGRYHSMIEPTPTHNDHTAALPLRAGLTEYIADKIGEDIADALKEISKDGFPEKDYAAIRAMVTENLRKTLAESREPMTSILQTYSDRFNKKEIDTISRYLALAHKKDFLEIRFFEMDLYSKYTKITLKMPNFKKRIRSLSGSR